MEVTKSVNRIPIRLTSERWNHIVENHNELAGMMFDVLEAIAKPDVVVQGWHDGLLSAKKINKHYLIVVYKEEKRGNDGFIITAFITSKINQIKKRKQVWPRKS